MRRVQAVCSVAGQMSVCCLWPYALLCRFAFSVLPTSGEAPTPTPLSASASASTSTASASASASSGQLTGQYELLSVLTHKGRSADSGHYVGWVKQEDGEQAGQRRTKAFFHDSCSASLLA